MNILVITESLRINETSSGIVSSTFISALVTDKNIKVTCLYHKNFDYEISWFKDVTLSKIKKTKFKRDKFLYKIPKMIGMLTYVKGIHPKDKLAILDWKEGIKSAISLKKYDLIITLGSGAEFQPHYAMLGVDTKIPWLANFHDPYPMSVYPEPYRKKKNLIFYHQEKITKRITEKADYLSFPSLLLSNLMQEKYEFKDSKIVILPHVGIHLDNLPADVNDSKVHLKDDKFNIVHAGTLLGPRKIDSFLKAYKLFIDSDIEKKIKSSFTIFGSVAPENFLSLKTDLESENFQIVTDRISYKKSLELLKIVDVALIVEAKTDFSPFMPGKLADLIFMEKTILVLGPTNSETLRILGKNYPYHSNSDDMNQILNCLHNLWDSWKKNNLDLPNKKKLKDYISGSNLIKNIKILVHE